MKNICIVGSKPDTWQKCGNLDRRSWQIWRFSRKNYEAEPKADVWFELHHPDNYERYEHQKPGYREFIKDAVTYKDFPWEEILKEFGPWFLHYGQQRG